MLRASIGRERQWNLRFALQACAFLHPFRAVTRFLSLEPLLGPLPDLELSEIDWVIVVGESGPGARPLEEAWVTDIRDQCIGAGVPFFFKQWGGVFKKRTGRTLEGRTSDEMPGVVAPNARRVRLALVS
jgi:protein gp37